MPMAAAFSYAGAWAAGAWAYALIIPLNAVLGFACAWLLETARMRVIAHATRKSGSVPPGWYPQAFYVAAVLWMALSWVLGLWLSSAVLPLVG